MFLMGGFEIKIFNLGMIGFFLKVILVVVVDRGMSSVVVIVMYVVYFWSVLVIVFGRIWLF